MHRVRRELLKTCKGAVCKKKKKKKKKDTLPPSLPPQTNRVRFQRFASLVCYIDQNQISPKVHEYSRYKYYICLEIAGSVSGGGRKTAAHCRFIYKKARVNCSTC